MSEPKWEPCPVCGEDWSPETDPCLATLARRVQRLEGALGHVHYLASKVEDKPEGRLIGIGDLARATLVDEEKVSETSLRELFEEAEWTNQP